MFDWLKGAGLERVIDALPVSFSSVASQLGEVVLPVASLASWGGLTLCSVVVLGLFLERRRRSAPPAHHPGKLSGTGKAPLVQRRREGGIGLL